MNNNGFTLVELVISFSITVIMFGIVTVSFIPIERYRLIQSAYILRTDLRYCQKNAIEEKRRYGISIDVNNNLYYILRADDEGLLRKISQVKLEHAIQTNTNSIAFTPQGTVNGAGTITLRGKFYYLEITINVGCGRVKIGQIKKLIR